MTFRWLSIRNNNYTNYYSPAICDALGRNNAYFQTFPTGRHILVTPKVQFFVTHDQYSGPPIQSQEIPLTDLPFGIQRLRTHDDVRHFIRYSQRLYEFPLGQGQVGNRAKYGLIYDRYGKLCSRLVYPSSDQSVPFPIIYKNMVWPDISTSKSWFLELIITGTQLFPVSSPPKLQIKMPIASTLYDLDEIFVIRSEVTLICPISIYNTRELIEESLLTSPDCADLGCLHINGPAVRLITVDNVNDQNESLCQAIMFAHNHVTVSTKRNNVSRFLLE